MSVDPARRLHDGSSRTSGAREPSASLATNRGGVANKALRPSTPSRTTCSIDITSQRARNVAKPALTAAVERARSYPPFSTSLTVGVDGARIKLLLRRDGPTLHVIALCAERNVELVRRALACADAHLRRSGESIRASVRTLAEVRA